MSAGLPARGVYGITPQALCNTPEALLAAVDVALAAGLALLQYRDKQGSAGHKLALAKALAQRCAGWQVPLIINDDPALAAASGAQGVHLGLADASLAEARAMLGPAALIGITCGNSLARAEQAAAAGADYLAFGAFFPSRTKPGTVVAPLSLLGEARARWALPLCAIGGITAGNAGPLVAAGASYLAAVEGVFAGDVAANVRGLAAHFG